MTGSDAVVLLIGGGGREHALAIKLIQSSNVSKVFVSPGNAGTGNTEGVENIDLNLKKFDCIHKWCKDNSITLVVVGPEDPLAEGIVDFMTDHGIPCFGPSSKAAQIESSKDFSKKFMTRHKIPTARFKSFTAAEEACRFINDADYDALVVKASGLAAGKGVVVASSRQQAQEAAKDMLTGRIFGGAGETVVVEELLEGPEVSILAFSDGHNVALMPPAQDHKRLLDGDQGPNTGGMGAVCPYPGLSAEELEDIQKNIIEKTVRGLAEEGIKYIGVLYAGLMLTKDGPKVLEFNCRFGDPETQSILSLMTSDLLATMKACVEGCLPKCLPTFDLSRSVVGVMVVSGGYPGSYKKGLSISGVSAVQNSGCQVIQSGTKQVNAELLTSGGRVLAVLASDPLLSRAMEMATRGAAKVTFEGAFYRKDIGAKLLKSSKTDGTVNGMPEIGKGLSYKDAGVDIAAGDRLVQVIKPLAKMTRRAGCDADIGGFGGLFDLGAANLANSLLTFTTRGVGGRIKLAELAGCHYSIGHDLVTCCVNDLMSQGAQPIYFLDYFAVGRLDVGVAAEVVRGMAEACQQAGCALIGGETAEMPGMYAGNDYDVAGFAVGAVPQSQLERDTGTVSLGDQVIGVTSIGLQSCDLDLLQTTLMKPDMLKSMVDGFWEKLLSPSEMYVKAVLPLIQDGKVSRFCCVNDGLKQSVARLLGCSKAKQSTTTSTSPAPLTINLNANLWRSGALFNWAASETQLASNDLVNLSSCGLSALLIVKPEHLSEVQKMLSNSFNSRVSVIGQVVCTKDQLTIEHQGSLVKTKQYNGLSDSTTNKGMPMPSLGEAISMMSCVPKVMRPGVKVSKGQLPTFDLKGLGMSEPVLVSGTDGVGTKLKIAQAVGHHSGIGQDLVAMCVNDVLASGATPLLFTSYLAAGSVHPDWTPMVMEGVAEGCRLAGCALAKKRLSMLPSVYKDQVYDLGGFAVAAAEKAKLLPLTSSIEADNVLIGLPSSGIHSNGFSLVRKVVEINGLRYDQPSPFTVGTTLGEDLLTPTRIYVQSVLPALQDGKVKAFAHITGGGLVENIPRVLPSHLGVCLDTQLWAVNPVFGWLQYLGNLSSYEMSRTFNCGLGAVMVVSQADVPEVMGALKAQGERPAVVGSVVPWKDEQKPRVEIKELQSSLESCWPRPKMMEARRRVGVLISGSGTNLQALIDHSLDKKNKSNAVISLVISNKPGVKGLARASRAGIPTLVIPHKDFKTRPEFDAALHAALVDHGIDLVCLAGFMRILTGGFVNKWAGRMLNIHPSLLPSFKGADAHKQVLEARVRLSGCSVHFVAEEVDAGAIIVQHSVPVFHNDTEHTLGERVKAEEHSAFPAALDMVASGQVELGGDGKLLWHW